MNRIICKGCQNQYSESQKPFFLPCGHNLCAKCISKRIYSERCFFCPFDKTFIKFENCKLDLILLKQSTKKSSTQMPPQSPFQSEKYSTPIPKTPTKSVNFLEPPKNPFIKNSKDETDLQNESIGSINTEYLYPSASEKKIAKPNLMTSTPKPLETRSKVRKPPRAQESLKKRKRSKSCKRVKDSTINYEQVALVTASVLGGVYFLSNLGASVTKSSSSGLMNAVKSTSSFAVKNLMKLVKKD